MMQELAGKVAIVTGSTQGLGLGIAVALARSGATVVANGRSEGRADAVRSTLDGVGGEWLFVAADVSQKGDAERLVTAAAERFGGVDILINNAQAIAPLTAIEADLIDAAFEETIASGLYASLWMARAVLPHMQRRGGGRIVNFGSINAEFGALYGAHYNATKTAILGLTRTMANEWGRHGVTVNMVLPAGLSPAFEAFIAADPARGEAMLRQHPMRRHGRAAEDIGEAIVGLVSDDAGYVTGQALYIDGGASLLGLPQFNSLEGGA